MAESFEAGRGDRPRRWPRARACRTIIRVSDEEETEGSLALSGPRGARRRGSSTATWALRKRRGGALMIVGFEGEEESVARRRALAVRALRARRRRLPRPGGRALLGARPLPGPLPARHADGDGGDGRDAGDLAHLEPARRAARRGRRRRSATRSPARARRASSSATSRTPTPTAPRSTSPSSPAPAAARSSSSGAQVKRAACEAIVAGGGTITHHHAVGRDHAPYMEAEVGQTGLDVLRAVKEQLDPAGIMNPGKLLPG